MAQTKTYNFDKDYLILNKMSAHYTYSEKPFSYYDFSEIVTGSHTISSVTIRLYKGDRESKTVLYLALISILHVYGQIDRCSDKWGCIR